MAYRLPLQVGDGIGAGAGQRHDVILAITRISAAGFACRWAGMLAMEFPCYLAGSERAYNWPAMVLNVVLRFVPTKVNAAMAATAINAAINAYSMAVTPD